MECCPINNFTSDGSCLVILRAFRAENHGSRHQPGFSTRHAENDRLAGVRVFAVQHLRCVPEEFRKRQAQARTASSGCEPLGLVVAGDPA